MTKKNTDQASRKIRQSEPKLDSRYGKIGISAVAAALPYRSAAQRTRPDKPVRRQDDRFADIAA